jgi:TolB-like protein
VRAFRVTGTPTVVVPARTQTADKPSIAVLPFTNMSDDPEQEYFSDGVTEDITLELARFSELLVIARNTAMSFKGQNIDVRSIAAELRVSFVLEGSVRKVGNQVRISVQLIDGQSGSHVWAERYDGPIENIFVFQDDVTHRVAGAVGGRNQNRGKQQGKF